MLGGRQVDTNDVRVFTKIGLSRKGWEKKGRRVVSV